MSIFHWTFSTDISTIPSIGKRSYIVNFEVTIENYYIFNSLNSVLMK